MSKINADDLLSDAENSQSKKSDIDESPLFNTNLDVEKSKSKSSKLSKSGKSSIYESPLIDTNLDNENSISKYSDNIESEYLTKDDNKQLGDKISQNNDNDQKSDDEISQNNDNDQKSDDESPLVYDEKRKDNIRGGFDEQSLSAALNDFLSQMPS